MYHLLHRAYSKAVNFHFIKSGLATKLAKSCNLQPNCNIILSIYTQFAATVWCSPATKFTETHAILREIVSHTAEMCCSISSGVRRK